MNKLCADEYIRLAYIITLIHFRYEELSGFFSETDIAYAKDMHSKFVKRMQETVHMLLEQIGILLNHVYYIYMHAIF